MLTLALASFAIAAPPVPYQGRVLDSTGEAVEGDSVVTFAIYDRAEDAEPVEGEPPPDNSPLWSDDLPVTFSNGYFAVNLGAEGDLDGIFDGGDRWVELTLGGASMPRQPIHAVPMATFSEHSETTARLTEWSQWGPSDYAAAAGLCSGMLHDSYGQLAVVRSNGSNCNSACDAQDGGSAPYQNYHCYGSVGTDYVAGASGDPGSNAVVFRGWFGVNYCDSTNGMNRFCCCKSNYNSAAN